MSLLQIATLLFEALLGLFSAYTAYSLFAWTPPSLAKAREALHYPRWYWVLAGCVATIGALGLLVGLFLPVIGALAAAWMVAYFVVATLRISCARISRGLRCPSSSSYFLSACSPCAGPNSPRFLRFPASRRC